MAKLDKHDLIAHVIKLAEELGRTPTRVDFQNSIKGGRHKLDREFGGVYSSLVEAAGLDTYDTRRMEQAAAKKKEEKQTQQYQKYCGKPEKVQGHFVHKLDLAEMFRLAGNPPVLKMTGWPDVHVKFMDVPAVECALKVLKYFAPHVFLLYGDFADCEGLSHWPTSDLAPRRIVPEMLQCRELLKKIGEHSTQVTTRIFLTGNHEDWIVQSMGRMPEFFEDLELLGIDINVTTLLGLDKAGYQVFPLNHIVRIGKSHHTHGLFTGNNHAKKHLDALNANIYYGHLHDTQEYNKTSLEGPIEAASTGTLARKDAKFLRGRPNNWVHSVSHFEFFPDGSYNRYKIIIENGRTSFNGIVFDGNENGKEKI